jgi:hypothetical protein
MNPGEVRAHGSPAGNASGRLWINRLRHVRDVRDDVPGAEHP